MLAQAHPHHNHFTGILIVIISVRRRAIDFLICFYADSNNLDPTNWKKKKQWPIERKKNNNNKKAKQKTVTWQHTIWCTLVHRIVGRTCWIYKLCISIWIYKIILTLLIPMLINKDLCRSMRINFDQFWSIKIYADLWTPCNHWSRIDLQRSAKIFIDPHFGSMSGIWFLYIRIDYTDGLTVYKSLTFW